MPDTATNLAVRLRDMLCRQNQRLVLAESCTAGRIAASLGTLPGISDLTSGRITVRDFKELDVEDLLGREHVVV